ncbi:MAG: PIN domain-containing protein [Capsulimonas sp.]|uniref:type II toxin-antitoxin system VapC family toxin n=1 Tax=Capsulimonas sp. TaxID=2494211 RepID=UPI003263942B
MPIESSSVLLDTNILVRLATPSDPKHTEVVNILAKMAAENTILNICPQNMGELRQVATRPTASNGLGWTSTQTALVMNAYERKFVLIPEPHAVYTIWRRIVAVAEANRLDAILTYEAKAFVKYGVASGLTILDPANV